MGQETRSCSERHRRNGWPFRRRACYSIFEELPPRNPRKLVRQLGKSGEFRRRLDLFPVRMRLVQGLVEGFFRFLNLPLFDSIKPLVEFAEFLLEEGPGNLFRPGLNQDIRALVDVRVLGLEVLDLGIR